MGIGAAVGGVAALGGGLLQANAAGQAAQAQEQAAQIAANTQLQMFNQTQQNLQPFIQGGQNTFNQLQSALPSLTANFNPTQAQLAQTPGYQFTLNQGLMATQNGYAAQGLGKSGSALQGASQYATGLANQTYNQQLQNYLAQNMQQYNMLQGTSTLGANAAAGLATNATTTGQGVAASQLAGGQAAASGYLGSANALSNAASGISQYALLNQLMGNNSNQGNTTVTVPAD